MKSSLHLVSLFWQIRANNRIRQRHEPGCRTFWPLSDSLSSWDDVEVQSVKQHPAKLQSNFQSSCGPEPSPLPPMRPPVYSDNCQFCPKSRAIQKSGCRWDCWSALIVWILCMSTTWMGTIGKNNEFVQQRSLADADSDQTRSELPSSYVFARGKGFV